MTASDSTRSASDPRRIGNWMLQIATTAEEEADCDALQAVLERLLVLAEEGLDVAGVLPDVAAHLDHCPECSDCYATLVAMLREGVDA